MKAPKLTEAQKEYIRGKPEPIRQMMTLDETAGVKVWGRVKLEFLYEPNGTLVLELAEPTDLSRVWCAAETILRICRSTAVVTADHLKGK